MKLSDRISVVAGSATIGLTTRAAAMKAEGIDVVSFAAGEPDFDTPDFIKDAAKAALDAGDTKYTPRAAKALKQAIVEKLARDNALQVDPSQVLVAFGGKHVIYNACQVLLNPGDGVLIPAPYWVSYPEMVKLAGGRCIYLETSPQNDFKITPQQILDAAGSAKVLILNSPSNPTGVTYTPQEMRALAEAVLQTDLFVISDEIYEKLIYGGTEFTCFAALDPRLPERTLTVNGLSKTYSMTGWRLGWSAGPKDVTGAMARLMSHATTDPVSFAVAGAVAAYTDARAPEAVEKMRLQFEKRGRHMAKRLNAMPGVSCTEPTGAFYCFPDVSAHYGREISGTKVASSMDLAAVALDKFSIALVPGDAFGEDRCVRLSFATSMEQIDKGLDRLEQLLAQ